MNCKFVESRLAAYIDGELDGAEMLRVRSHVSECDSCEREIAELRLVKTMIGSLPNTRPDPEFESRLLTAVHADDTRTVRVNGVFSLRLGWGGLTVAAAASVLAVIVVGINRDRSEQVAGVPLPPISRDGFESDQIYFQSNSPLSSGVTVSYDGAASNR